MSDRELRLQILLDAMDKASGPIGAIRKESRLAGAAIGETRSELKKLDQAQKDIRGFRDLKRGLRETEQELGQARQRAAALARQINQTEKPTRQLTREFARAKREAAELGDAFDRQQRKLQESRDKLKAAGISTRSLADDERRLAAAVKSTNAELGRRNQRFRDLKAAQPGRINEARAVADERARRADRWDSGARYGAGVVGTVVGAAATATGVDAVVETAKYEEVMTSLGQKANFSREQAQRLGETLRRLSPDVARLPEEMAQAADTLAGIGLLNQYEGIQDPEKRFRAIEKATAEITRVSGKAATAYKAEQDDMVRSIAAGVQNLKIPADRAARIADIMAAGDNAGAFGMAAMAREMPSLTGAWGALGQTGEKALGQLIAGLETARLIAGTDEEAANNLQNLILKLNSKELSDNFGKFGVDLPAALKKAKREGRDLLEVVAELTNKATKGDNDKIARIFTDQQAQLAITALITKAEEYKKIRDGLGKSDGTVDKQFAERMNDQATKYQRMKAQWTSFEVEVGKAMKPVTDTLVDSATATLDKLAANVRARGLWATGIDLVAGRGMMSGETIRAVEAAKPELERRKRRQAAAARATGAPAAPVPAKYAAPAAAGPKPQAAVRELKAVGNARMFELARQNQEARKLQAQGISDQHTAGAQSIAQAQRHKDQMRQAVGSPADYTAMGGMMMRGLSLGMTASAPGVLASIFALGERIKAAFRGSMQIRSPSRVFARYGEYMTEGLALGIAGGKSAPMSALAGLNRGIDASMNRQVLAPPKPRVAATGAAGGSGDTFHITIQGLPGETAEAMARRMMAEIERLKSNKRRGAYQDD